jgi:hypothetical protein
VASRGNSKLCLNEHEYVKRLQNLTALREVGFQANQRLLNAQNISHDPIPGRAEFQKLNTSVEASGQRAGPLRFGDPKVKTLLSVLLLFRFLVREFSNRDLREHGALQLGTTPDSLTSGQLTYQLRRPHALIERIPKTHRYQLVPSRAATIDQYLQNHSRVLCPELAPSRNSTTALKIWHTVNLFVGSSKLVPKLEIESSPATYTADLSPDSG